MKDTSNTNDQHGLIKAKTGDGSDENKLERMRKRPRTQLPKFERAPYWREMSAKEFQEKFDKMPAQNRHYIKRLIQTNNFKKAGVDAGILDKDLATVKAQKAQLKDISTALNDVGLDIDQLSRKLYELLDAKVIRFDKHGKKHEFVDPKFCLDLIRLCLECHSGKFAPRDASQFNAEELFKDTKVNE